MKIQILAAFVSLFVFASLFPSVNSSQSLQLGLRGAEPTPTPSDMKKNQNTELPVASGPISMPASASGVSLPVRDLPPTRVDPIQPPREINPQNSISVKTVQSATEPSTKLTSLKPSKRKKISRVKKR